MTSCILQDPDLLKQKFHVYRLVKEVKIPEFLRQKNLVFEREVIFYQFPKTGMDLLYYRDVVRVSIAEVCICEQTVHILCEIKHLKNIIFWLIFYFYSLISLRSVHQKKN